MNRRFVIRSAQDRPSCRALAKVQNYLGKVNMLHFIIVCGVIVLFCAAVLVWAEEYREALQYACLGALFVLFGLKWDALVGWMLYRGLNHKVGEVTYVFEEDGMHIACEVENAEAKYAMLTKLTETNGYFMLYVHKSSAYALPKSAFVEGDCAEFAAFLEEKTGQKFRRIRSL